MSQPVEAEVLPDAVSEDDATAQAAPSPDGIAADAIEAASPEGSLIVREDPAGPHAVVPVLELPEDLAFEELKARIDVEKERLSEAFAGRAGRLDLQGRAVDLFDLRRLIHHLEDGCGCSITGLYATEAAVTRFAERELKLKLFLHGVPAPDPLTDERVEDGPPAELTPDGSDEAASSEEAPAAPSADVALDPDGLRIAEDADPAEDSEVEAEPEPEAEVATGPEGTRTLQVHRTVRSGNAVRFDGDVTIFGDVNPGAMVTASGSIIVLGALKGVAHAGATGDETAFILGLHLQPTQIRIGRRIAIASEDRTMGPELAVIRDGRIVIEPYRSSSMARRNR